MRRFSAVAGVIVLAALAAGCETTQPAQSGDKIMSVSFTTRAAVEIVDVWEWYLDADQDGVPDRFYPDGTPIDPPIQVQCKKVWEPSSTPGSGSVKISERDVPWPHSVQIRHLKNGETESFRVSTEDAQSSMFNLTGYDITSEIGQPGPPCSFPEVCVKIGRLSTANRVVINSRYEDLLRQDDPLEPTGLFVCPGAPGLGGPRLDGTIERPEAPPFVLEVEQGDSLIVQARKAEQGLNDIQTSSPPILNGFITVNGSPVNPTGTASSTTETASGVNFSYTLR